jgi:hypothetical protein
MVTLLGDLYTAETLGQTPGSPNPEVRDAESVVAAISRPSSSGAGQGIGLTVEERRAVEHRAMHQATVFLTANGFAVRDVSKIESFDLLAIRGSEQIRVEVKGTTGGLSSVLLTANEVEMHRAIYPNNALVVVHSIQLLRINGLIGSSGGDLVSWLPWKIKDENLRAITYSYRLPPP